MPSEPPGQPERLQHPQKGNLFRAASALLLIVFGVAVAYAVAGHSWVAALVAAASALTGIWCRARALTITHDHQLSRLGEIAGTLGEPVSASSVTPQGEAGAASAQDPAPDEDVFERTRQAFEVRSAQLAADRVSREAAHAELLGIIDAIDVPMLAVDDTGRIVRCNVAATRLLPRRGGSLINAELEDVFTPVRMIELYRAARAGAAMSDQISMLTDDEVRTFQVAARPVQSRGRVAVVLTLRDVTASALAGQLRTDFVANASHELRTPIASIKAAIETLRAIGTEDADARARFESMIAAGAARLEEMVTDLLDLSRLESSARPVIVGRVELDDLVAKLRGLFESACEARGVRLEFETAPVQAINTDESLILLILRNLIDNAIKFSPKGGTVRINAAGNGDGGVTFEVIDTGCGIPLKHQSRIFERFYQVDDSRARTSTQRGSGLGLALVRNAARKLGGDVGVHSVWQQGTRMTVSLPAAQLPAADQSDQRSGA